MIYNRPEVEKRLDNFKCNQEKRAQIHELLSSGIQLFDAIRIESEPGNGSSHLLNAIANDLRIKGEKIAFLNFKEGDRFSNLSPYHLTDILLAEFLFIDDLPVILVDNSKDDLFEFLGSFAATGGKLFYSSNNVKNDPEKDLISNCFEQKAHTISLESVSTEIKKKWAKDIIGEEYVLEIPQELFDTNESNKDFLEAIKPFQEKFQIEKGTHHSFNREYEHRMNTIRLKLRQHQLKIAELQIEKEESIRKQLYESAAGIRDRERSILSEIDLLQQEVLKMKNELPFIPNQLDLHYKINVLLNQINGDKSVLDELNKLISQRIDSLSEQWEQLKKDKETLSNRKVIVELRDWEEAIFRFNKMNKK